MDLEKHVLVASDAVDQLASHLRAAIASPEPMDLEDVVLRLRDLNAVVAQLRDATADLASYGASLMPQQVMTVAGLPIERTGGWNRKGWQHDALLSQVVRWAREDQQRWAQEHDGEVRESEGQAVVRVLREVAALSYWKVGATKDRGLDVDEYCRKEPAKPGIKMPRGL